MTPGYASCTKDKICINSVYPYSLFHCTQQMISIAFHERDPKGKDTMASPRTNHRKTRRQLGRHVDMTKAIQEYISCIYDIFHVKATWNHS